MSIEGINVAMAISSLKTTSHAAPKTAAAQASEPVSEERMESAATQASEGEKGGNINVYA